MKLEKYFKQNVKIIFKDDQKTTGFVETYTPSVDTDNELYDEIGIINSPNFPWFLSVTADEIKSIEIIG